MSKDSEAVVVAKVTARQAIVVALITAAAGVIGVLLAGRKAGATTTPHWLRIEGIETRSNVPMRLVISVNGEYHSYPSTAVWITPGPRIPREEFRLPEASRYHISFRLLAQDGSRGESSQVDVVAPMPVENRTYDLWDGTITRSGDDRSPPTRVRYSLK
jgi:hypothetical protein